MKIELTSEVVFIIAITAVSLVITASILAYNLCELHH